MAKKDYPEGTLLHNCPDRSEGHLYPAVKITAIVAAVLVFVGLGGFMFILFSSSRVRVPNIAVIGTYAPTVKATTDVLNPTTLFLMEGGTFSMYSLTKMTEAPTSKGGTWNVVGDSVILYDGSGKETGDRFKIEDTNLRSSDGTLWLKAKDQASQ